MCLDIVGGDMNMTPIPREELLFWLTNHNDPESVHGVLARTMRRYVRPTLSMYWNIGSILREKLSYE